MFKVTNKDTKMTPQSLKNLKRYGLLKYGLLTLKLMLNFEHVNADWVNNTTAKLFHQIKNDISFHVTIKNINTIINHLLETFITKKRVSIQIMTSPALNLKK